MIRIDLYVLIVRVPRQEILPRAEKLNIRFDGGQVLVDVTEVGDVHDLWRWEI